MISDIQNYKFVVSYDGTAYSGWQCQPKRKSVQEAIETSIEKALKLQKASVKINASGRTDAGVHALRQVFSVELPKIMPPHKLCWVINRVLPQDISLESAEEVPKEFHARYDSQAKTYRYRILHSEQKNPFEANRVWVYKQDLDVEKMTRVSKFFEGSHDFRSFMSSGSDKDNTVRTIYSVELNCRPYMDNNFSGQLIEMTFRGDGFLYNMVRNMVGLITQIGCGILDETVVHRMLVGNKRSKEVLTAPAQGLYLMSVDY